MQATRHPILPERTSPLVGREREFGTALRLLMDQSVRVLTVTGVGGVGKTRLAIELLHAPGLQSAFHEQIFFVDLSTATDRSLVATVIADTMEFARSTPAGPPLESLTNRRALLVLDNIEQIEGVADEIRAIVAAYAELVVVVTSREPLQLRGEHRLRLDPLPLADPQGSVRQQLISPAPALALFEMRARAIQTDFALAKSNVWAIARICAKLDGLPLAVELAAQRISVLGPEAILRGLDDALSFLEWRTSDTPERHWSLANTFNWSYRLLEPREQALFRALALFPDTFDLAAAAALGHLSTRDCLASLQRLVDKSLVSVVAAKRNETRFRLLELVRAFALKLLAEASSIEDGRIRQHRHRAEHRASRGLIPPEGQSGSGKPVVLSEREREVLLLMSEGMRDAEIARHLVMSERTARFHVASILRKLGAANRTQAVVAALRQGL